jgi:hypothetical protein
LVNRSFIGGVLPVVLPVGVAAHKLRAFSFPKSGALMPAFFPAIDVGQFRLYLAGIRSFIKLFRKFRR